QAALQRVEKAVDTANDGRTRIEDQPTARSNPGKALLGNSNCEVDAELSAAMAIEPPVIIDEVGRVGDDDVGIAVNSAKNIAVHGLCRRQAIESGVDEAECQRFVVYVGEDQLDGLAEKASCEDPTHTASGSDINERSFVCGKAGKRSPQQPDESIGVGAEKDGIPLICGEAGMHEQKLIDASESDLGPVTAGLPFEGLCIFEQLENPIVYIPAV